MLGGMLGMRRHAVGQKVRIALVPFMALLGLLPASRAAMAVPQSGVSITTGYYQTCAIETGQAYCWGPNGGELGDGSTAASGIPAAVDTSGVLAGKALAQVSAGDSFACALDTSGQAYCWGINEHGDLGDGSSIASSDVPVQAGPSPPADVTAVPGNRSAVVSWAAPAMPGGSVTSYTALASPGGELCMTATTSCTITGLTNQAPYSVTVIARTATASSYASAPVSVTPSSSGVSFVSNPYYTAASGAAFSFTVSASGSPAPTITRKGRLPSGVTFTDNGDGTATLAGTPSHGAAGQYPLAFTARSTAGTATQAFTLTVTKVPALARIPATTGAVNTPLNLPLTATGYPVPALTESGTLPDGVRFTGRGDGAGVISGTPAPGSGGRYPVTVTATSTSGTATRSFILKIDELPAITSANSTTAAIGHVFSFLVTTTGYPAPKITESGFLPKGVTFKPAMAVLHGMPRAGTSGSYPITITARNAAGTITQYFTLTVTGSLCRYPQVPIPPASLARHSAD